MKYGVKVVGGLASLLFSVTIWAHSGDHIEQPNHQNIVVADLATDLLNGVKKSVQEQTQGQKQPPAETKPTDTPPTTTNTSATSTETSSTAAGLRQPGESVKNCAIRLGGNIRKNRALCRSNGGQKQTVVNKQTPPPASAKASSSNSKARLPGESVNDCMARLGPKSTGGRKLKASKGNYEICYPYSERPDGTYN